MQGSEDLYKEKKKRLSKPTKLPNLIVTQPRKVFSDKVSSSPDARKDDIEYCLSHIKTNHFLSRLFLRG